MNNLHNHQGIYRHYLIRLLISRLHLFISITFGVLLFFLLPIFLDAKFIAKLLISLDFGGLAYILMSIHLMFFSTEDKMMNRAHLEEEGQFGIIVLVVGAMISSLTAIIYELSSARNMSGLIKYEHIALAAVTIIVSWVFTHLMFAIHYAHDYYLSKSYKKELGLDFPGSAQPDYSDFLYFSIVIGTSAQNSDVSFNTRKMRRVGSIHCMLSFFFNTTILAITINIASSLL